MASSDHSRLIRGDHLRQEVTPADQFFNRRQLVMAGAVSAGVIGSGAVGIFAQSKDNTLANPQPLAAKTSPLSLVEKTANESDATTYNNYYEFGLEKHQPAAVAPRRLKIAPWQISVEGLVNRPRVFDLGDLQKVAPLEERIYRLRCVEGWSMVIPWIGYPLSSLIKEVQPQGSAKFIEFTTLADSKQMPGLSSRVLRWPYHEGLRLDEAQHPLTLLTFGMYGKTLPAQNGAPVRMVVPWKYGFKSIKSIVKIRFTETQPTTSWSLSAPQEYGFYSNVNPDVAHPRWSQATERVLGMGSNQLFTPRRKTERFNGYESMVAQLYTGMDLKRFY